MSRKMSGHHRTAGNKYCWKIETRGRHKHAGNDLVAVRYHDHGVKLMRLRHAFDRIGDEFACNKRILHAFVSHCDAVAYTDGRKFNRRAARHADSRLYSVGNTVEFNMSRNDFVFCTAYAYERTRQFFVGIAHSIEQ